jgi:hypothetical protein
MSPQTAYRNDRARQTWIDNTRNPGKSRQIVLVNIVFENKLAGRPRREGIPAGLNRPIWPAC